jgi:hypothetical protein
MGPTLMGFMLVWFLSQEGGGALLRAPHIHVIKPTSTLKGKGRGAALIGVPPQCKTIEYNHDKEKRGVKV